MTTQIDELVKRLRLFYSLDCSNPVVFDAADALVRMEKELTFVSSEGNRLANDLRNITTERDALRAKLERTTQMSLDMVRQKESSELSEDELNAADFEGGYDLMVRQARSLFAVLAEPSADDTPAQQPKISNLDIVIHDLNSVCEWLNSRGYLDESRACLVAMGMLEKLSSEKANP